MQLPVRLVLLLVSAGLPSQSPRFAEVGEALPDGIGQVFATADYDADGDADLFSTTGVFLNERSYFRAGPSMPANFTPYLNVRSIAARDFTGDGRVDVLVGRLGGAPSGLALYVAPPAGGVAFGLQPVAIGGQTGAYEFVVADFDGDGDQDVVAAASSSAVQNWVLLWNDGLGGFSVAPATQWPLPQSSAAWLGAGDFDGDGRVDVVAATPNGPVWRRNLGGGAFSTTQALPALLVDIDTGVVGDFDGDGFDDLVLVDINGNDLRLRGSAAGLVGTVVVTGVGIAGAPLLAADLDGDGREEIVRSVVAVSGGTDGVLLVQAGTVSGPAAGAPIGAVSYAYGSPSPYVGLAAADFDGDGDRDLAIVSGGQAPWLFLGLAGAGVGLADKVVPAGFRRQVAPPRDLDGDGAADLLTASLSNGVVRLASYRNDGRGTFATDPTPAGSFAALTVGAGSWADLDGDGDDDLLLLSGVGSHFVLLNDGTGSFGLAATIGGVGLATAVAFGDFDGDQLTDIVIARTPSFGFPVVPKQPMMLRGLAAPSSVAFAPAVPFGVAEHLTDLGVFDFDLDGDMDLAAASGVSARLYDNLGAGTLSAQAPLAGAAATRLAVGDLDGDGDQDLVIGGQSWLWQSPGFVLHATHAAPVGELSLADADEDGDLDLFDSAGAVYAGDGTGTFAAPVAYAPHALTAPPTAVPAGPPIDLDADGDLDIVTPIRGTPGHFTVYANLTRHVARVGLGVPGDAQRMLVSGRSGDVWFLGASLPAAGAISLPPLGQLFLDPATLVVLAGGVMPAGGSAAFSLPLPAGVGGTTLTWQALVGARFSNATDTLILP